MRYKNRKIKYIELRLGGTEYVIVSSIRTFDKNSNFVVIFDFFRKLSHF